jgi:hypothetical protein
MLMAVSDSDQETVDLWFDRYKKECKEGLLDTTAFKNLYEGLLRNRCGESDAYLKLIYEGKLVFALFLVFDSKIALTWVRDKSSNLE